jgi:hypothetical protein
MHWKLKPNTSMIQVLNNNNINFMKQTLFEVFLLIYIFSIKINEFSISKKYEINKTK